MNVSELKSPHIKTGGICYFSRMLDKIRIPREGGTSSRTISRISVADSTNDMSLFFSGSNIRHSSTDAKQGGDGRGTPEWARSARGASPVKREIEVVFEFMRKRGWDDEGHRTPGNKGR